MRRIRRLGLNALKRFCLDNAVPLVQCFLYHMLHVVLKKEIRAIFKNIIHVFKETRKV